MSRTRRKDRLDIAKKQPDQVFAHCMGVWSSTPTAKEVRVAHQDGKKRCKPGRAAKVHLNKGLKAKRRRALDAVVEDPESAPLPKEPKNHIWNYN